MTKKGGTADVSLLPLIRAEGFFDNLIEGGGSMEKIDASH
jgi:hypothetical protein